MVIMSCASLLSAIWPREKKMRAEAEEEKKNIKNVLGDKKRMEAEMRLKFHSSAI